ncbi:MAG: serine/threonine-protein kinase [Myxococcales bacterium]
MPRRGDRLGAYVIERPIGEGASALVYAAHHDTLQKRVAVKVLLPAHANTDLAQRFVREGRATAKLEHPHVVDVIDVGTTDSGCPYLVMEFLDGEDLDHYLRRVGRLGVQETADLLIPVMAGLVAAHAAGIVHRDLKPQNIFLSMQGKLRVPKVVDFGISKVLDQDAFNLTGTKALLGTPFYMSPEQAQAKRSVDARSDVFALGVILYECVTGVKPFEGESLYDLLSSIVTAAPKPLSDYVPDAPIELREALAKALQKQPDARFGTMREFARALLPLSSQRTRALYASELEVHMESTARPVQVRHSGTKSPDGSLASSPPAPLKRKAAIALGAALVAGVAWAVVRDQARVPEPTTVALKDTTKLGTAAPAPAAMAPAVPREPAAEAQAPSQALSSTAKGEVARYEVSVLVDPPQATIVLDGHRMATSKLVAAFKVDGSTHVLEASAPGYRSASVMFQDAPPPARIQLEKLTAGAAKNTSGTPATTTPAAPASKERSPQWKPDPFGGPEAPPASRRIIEQPY